MAIVGNPPASAGANGFDIRMAFQPIVDTETRTVYAYEALVRGANGESATDVLAGIVPETRYLFDQQCREAAIEQAVAAGILSTGARLAINFMPDTISSPISDSERTIAAARRFGLDRARLIFEFSKPDALDARLIATIIEIYRKMSFATAFDDFGTVHAEQGLLRRFIPDIVKLDPELVRGICTSWARRLALEKMVELARELDIRVIAEGVETRAEFEKLQSLGIRYQQGYFIARPATGELPAPQCFEDGPAPG